MQITREIATRVLATIDAGLVKGLGNRIPGQMCVEAAVCYALDLPHGDDPRCVDQDLRFLKINLNDAVWSSPSARAAGLRRLGLAQLGTRGMLSRSQFLQSLSAVVIGKVLPRALRAASSFHIADKGMLLGLAMKCEEAPTATTATFVCNRTALLCEQLFYAADHACNCNQSSMARAVTNAAYVVFKAASRDGYMTERPSPAELARDAELAFFAEEVVQILIAMNAPGCQWLDLAPLT